MSSPNGHTPDMAMVDSMAPPPPTTENANSPGTAQAAAQGFTPISFLPYLKSARFADAVLKIKTSDGKVKTLPVHRIVLSSRSTFFDELFNGPQPTELNSKGLPVYGVPVLPVHRALHEVLGLSLWWVYSMDDTKVTLPDTKWDQILGVHHVSTVFKLPRLTQESERAIRNAIEGGTGAPDELFKIAEESKKWCFPDIEKRASTRLQELLLNTDSPESTLATTSLETLSTLVETMEPASHFALVRRYIDVRAAAKDPVPPEAVARLWSRVPFTSLSVTDLESAYSDATVPVASVVDATSRALLLQPSQGPTLSYELFNAALEPSASMTLGMSQSQVYRLVREYNAAHPELDEPRRDQLWNKVRFVELSVEELEDAYGSNDVPRAPVVAAMFSRLRTGPAAPSPSASPLPPNPVSAAAAYPPGSQYDPLMKPVPATPSPPPAMSYGHQHTPSYDFGNPPTGAAAKLSFDPYTPVPANGDAPRRVSEDKKRFPY